MNRFMIFIIAILTGVLQTFLVHSFGLHKGMEHMYYGDSWGWYVVETLLYSFSHLVIHRWSKNK
jgi:hypothetical protein